MELLVVLGLVGFLAALLLPAVQRARDAAWRVNCGNNLRQIGLAIQTYHGSYGMFPAPMGMPDRNRVAAAFHKQYSLFTQLLPSLGETPLYNSVNFAVGVQDFYLFPPLRDGAEANTTAMATVLGVLLCPADGGGGVAGWTAGTNYRVNLGAERWMTDSSNPIGGPLNAIGNTSMASVTDGLSNTVALGEKLRGRTGGAPFNPRTDMMVCGRLGLPYSPEDSLSFCAAQVGTPLGSYSWAGLSWFVGSLSHTCYNHIIEPNSIYVDCVGYANPIVGLLGARSNHAGGVNASMADGSVRFVTNAMSREVWEALGTRAGGESPAD